LAEQAPAHAHYLYPSDFFMWSAPECMQNRLPPTLANGAKDSFAHGSASKFSPSQLLQAGIFQDDPLRGGIFRRREEVKYIILHSTETGRPADASRVIKSWNRGMRHPGAQFVVDRDGIIHETVDPEFGTVHVDISRTTLGVNNDNSIGIEIVRSGDQQYTPEQLQSVTRLVVYLQQRFNVGDDHIYGHHQVQPSNRLDPVGFNWGEFNMARADLRNQTVAFKHRVHSAVVPHDQPAPAESKHMLDVTGSETEERDL
jgi:N-acetyl-anhydromuramyl-L-alanine amidase AmpD